MTTDDDALSAAGASRTVEIELKYDVDASTPLPDWSRMPVASVGEPELRELDAVYLDTAELALAYAGYALRRRTGGPDEGWHIKGPRDASGGRVELQWPLGDEDTIPDGVSEAIAGIVGDADLGAIARIRNSRTAYAFRDADGGLIAEFVDDHVVATDERDGVERTWREWEFELGPAAPKELHESAALLNGANDAIRAVGGLSAKSASKLARALGA